VRDIKSHGLSPFLEVGPEKDNVRGSLGGVRIERFVMRTGRLAAAQLRCLDLRVPVARMCKLG